MIRKTRQRPRPRPRPRPHTKKIHAARATEENAEVESHHYSSSMMFDGNTLVMKSQKDDDPIKERVYTKKQLEQEIPISKELMVKLDGKIPRGIQRPISKEIKFMSVLPNPDDLGLLPPNASSMKKYKLNHQQKQTKRRRENQSPHRYDKQRDNMRLMVQDADYAAGDMNRRHARNLFDLP
jgi:hypothetical protein